MLRRFGRVAGFLLKRAGPVYLHYGITHRCNLRCRMCGIRDEGGAELDLKQINEAFNIFRRMGILYVSIGGGEPMTRPDIMEAIRIIRKKGIKVRLLTNGLFLDEQTVKEFARQRIDEVSLSLDSLCPEKQDLLCDMPGVGVRIFESVHRLARILPRGKRKLVLNTVVSPVNITELPALCRFAHALGFYISFIPVENNGRPEFIFKPDSWSTVDRTYAELIELKAKSDSNILNSSLFLRKSPDYLKSGRCDWQCDAGNLYFSLSPKGDLSICHATSSLGNILNPGLEGYLRSAEFYSQREQRIKECAGCFRPCWAEVSFCFQDQNSLWEAVQGRLRHG